jgi:FAD/FMN-containing dehydrogenase
MTTVSDQEHPALAALQALLGERRLLRDQASLERFGRDRSPGWTPRPIAVALPESTGEVQQIVTIARAHGLALVPSGGRTGLCGGAVAVSGELVVALDRMNQLLEVDPSDRSVTVQAGMITARLQEVARERGWFYPVDFASSGSSQIGGNIATNAGGIRVIRYGMTRNQISGLVVVDGRGEILRLNHGLAKNNTGPDFRHLFIGSEGVFGIITEATVQLLPAPAPPRVMLFGIKDFPAILSLLTEFSNSLKINAFEFFSHNALEKVTARLGTHAPVQAASFYALVEFESGGADDEEQALAIFEQGLERGDVIDAVMASNEAQSRALWTLRESISDTLAAWQPWKNDISVRVGRLDAFIARVSALASSIDDDLELVWYGHIGDGNIHLNILKPDQVSADAFAERCSPVAKGIASLLAEFRGSVSAEHGIGLLKRDYLHYTRSEAEISALRAMKGIFDPEGIMNPGKLLPPG